MSSFSPDSPLVASVHPSPNHGERRDVARPDIILLHYTGMESTAAALARLCDPVAAVSCHYLVFESGEIVQLVPESRRAWHAGVSVWQGETDINSHSVGIEIANPGHDFGYPDFPAAQIEAVVGLCRDIIARQSIRPERVLAHADVAPERKQDPGEKFPWRHLHKRGVGLWVEPLAISAGPALAAGDKGSAVEELQTALAAFGYGIEVSGQYDERTVCIVTAFQRHFRPERVDGVADRSTIATLHALLEARPSA
jgi:N-acetylmuramoyl-L-alanine amidase